MINLFNYQNFSTINKILIVKFSIKVMLLRPDGYGDKHLQNDDQRTWPFKTTIHGG